MCDHLTSRLFFFFVLVWFEREREKGPECVRSIKPLFIFFSVGRPAGRSMECWMTRTHAFARYSVCSTCKPSSSFKKKTAVHVPPFSMHVGDRGDESRGCETASCDLRRPLIGFTPVSSSSSSSSSLILFCFFYYILSFFL